MSKNILLVLGLIGLFQILCTDSRAQDLATEFNNGYMLGKECFESSTNRFGNNVNRYDFETCIIDKEKRFKETPPNSAFLLGFNYSAFSSEELRLILESMNEPFDEKMVNFALTHYNSTRKLQKKLNVDNKTMSKWLNITPEELDREYQNFDKIQSEAKGVPNVP